MNGKGDKRRPKQVSNLEMDLRWELFDNKTTLERKKEIARILEEMKVKR